MLTPARIADALLYLHAAIVFAVIIPVPLILLGKLLGWAWVRNPWFRLAHLAVIGFVVVNSALGQYCPLTVWEQQYRIQAAQQGAERAVFSQWVEGVLYYNLPLWGFAIIYAGFGALVLGLFIWVPPEWKNKKPFVQNQ